ncbi:MAG: GMP synthase [Bacteroidota bacterium]
MRKLRLAVLDMNNGHPNQGLRCICSIVEQYPKEIDYEVYDVRVTNEVPDLSYDIYISSGGPGNPLEGNGIWEVKFTKLIDQLWAHNKKATESAKKHAFFICHSFQLVCNHFQLGEITKRHSTSFGIFPVHKTKVGQQEIILNDLGNPFYAIDSRDWQLVQPKLNVIKKWGAKILALEKIRDHVAYERAIMAVRFSEEFIGTQFHPEADAAGMKAHLSIAENREKIIKNFGKRKYNQMMKLLAVPETIAATHEAILPAFIENAIRQRSMAEMTAE